MCSLSSEVTVQLKFIEKQAISGRIGLVWSSRQECCEQCCMYDIAVLAVIVWICLGGRKQVFVSLGDWVQKLSPQIGRRYEMIECNWGRVIMLHYQDDEKPFLSALPVGFCFVWCGFFLFIFPEGCLVYFTSWKRCLTLFFFDIMLVRNQLQLMLSGFSFCDIQKYLLEMRWELVIHSATEKSPKDIGACQRDSFKIVTAVEKIFELR